MKKWLIISAAFFIMACIILLFIQNRFFQTEPFSEAEALQHIEAIYNGQVKQTEKRGTDYNMVFARDGAIYTVLLDAASGQVKELELKETERKALLSEKQIKQLMASAYGEVENIKLNHTIYTVLIENKDTQKELTIDAYTGKILTEKDIQPVKQPEGEGVLSEQQAIKIALQQLNGEIDSVDYEETEDGGYYLVEIETKDEEAVFQIHAISGKVMSVSWDEDH
ncbi:PepSY domain-containing protein [Lysinibacillus sp. NPDC047702]|uniref:PepSY domain-containing protein n=1 Tax=unclassified Lysinibacillus TaxID=2636778 RepID=UPI003D058847